MRRSSRAFVPFSPIRDPMTGNIRKNVGKVAGLTMVSRVLGLVREMLQARLVGAGWEQSAFAFAFMLPNLARRLFGEGALTAAFVPVFKEEVEQKGLEKAGRLARAVLSLMTLMLGAFVLLVIVGLSAALAWAPEFSVRTALILRLLRIMLPYMVFICAAAFGMGVLNALGRFGAPAFAPCLLNFFWIATLAALWFLPGVSVVGRVTWVSVAILLAGIAQMAYLLREMRKAGVRPAIVREGWGDEQTRLVWKRTFSAAVGSGAQQINTVASQTLALIAAPWAVGVINYADRLMELPLAVVGTAFGTVLLPTYAAHFTKNDFDGARDTFVGSVRDLLFLMLPASVGLAVLAPDIVRVFYQGHAFTDVDTVRVSRALAAYAAGLAFFGFQKALVPWFQAQGDVATPRNIAIQTLLVNVTLNVLSVFLLPVEWRHVGIAASLGLSAVAACVALSVLALRRNGSLGFRRLAAPIAKTLVAALAMGAVLLAVRTWVPTLSDGWFGAVLRLGVLVATGALVYFVASFLLLPSSARAVMRRFRRSK